MRTKAIMVAALVPLVAACGAGEAGSPAGAVAAVDTVGGIERLSYPADPAGALRWRADTVGVLGDAFAEDEYQFDRVMTESLAADAEGGLYVLDNQGARVLHYDAAGRHTATLGGRGQGPGELSQPRGLALGPGDTVWVSDAANARLTGYPADGGTPRMVPFDGTAMLPSTRMVAVDDGFLIAFHPMALMGPGGPGAPPPSGGGDRDAPGVSLVRTDGALAWEDTVWRSPEPPMDIVRIEAGNRRIGMMMGRELWPELQWAGFSDGGVVISDGAAYALHLLGPDGGVRRIITRAPEPRPTTEADREAVRQRTRTAAFGGIQIGGSLDADMQNRLTEERLARMTFADVVPRVVELRVDPRDRIWVGVSEENPQQVDRIDIYDREGVLLGELREFPMPDVFLAGDRIGVLRRDDLDVQQIVVLEVTGDGASFSPPPPS